MAQISKYDTAAGPRYRVRYRTPDRRQTDKRGFRTKRDAQAWAEQLEVDKRRGAYVAPAAGRVKLGEHSREWLDSKHNLSPSTRARYRVIVETTLARYANVALGDISRQLVREWVAEWSTESSPATVQKTTGVLRQMLAMAVSDNRLVLNPVDGVELPAVQSVEQRFLTLEQLHRLAGAAGENRPLVYLLGTCGLRFGEVAELRWRDTDLRKMQIRVARSVTLVDGKFVVGKPKSGKGRTVSLPAFVAEMLTAGEPNALVFPDTEGGHMRGTKTCGGGGGGHRR